MPSENRILVINPNSNQAVTDGISDAVDGLRVDGGPRVDCWTLAEGPFGIESQADSESVVMPLRRLIGVAETADAYVIACYSDPGLKVCREATSKPVFGIQESAILWAAARGNRFGVIARAESSIPNHLRYIHKLGFDERLANERAINISVAESAEAGAYARLAEVGAELRDQDQADVIILGCAGMARHRAGLEAELGLPVVEPCQAATAMALGATLLDG